jgi:hypothetical protein
VAQADRTRPRRACRTSSARGSPPAARVRDLVIGRHKHVLYAVVNKGSLPVNGAMLDLDRNSRANGLAILTTRAHAPTPMVMRFLYTVLFRPQRRDFGASPIASCVTASWAGALIAMSATDSVVASYRIASRLSATNASCLLPPRPSPFEHG